MGKVIRFPTERRQPHVALSWDDAWSQYLVEVRIHGPHVLGWFGDYGEAFDAAVSMAERAGLPIIDLTRQGKVA